MGDLQLLKAQGAALLDKDLTSLSFSLGKRRRLAQALGLISGEASPVQLGLSMAQVPKSTSEEAPVVASSSTQQAVASPTTPVVLASKTTSDTAIADWLSSTNPAVAIYAEGLAEYGYDNVGVLMDAEEADLVEAFETVQVKKPHQKVILKAIAALARTMAETT